MLILASCQSSKMTQGHLFLCSASPACGSHGEENTSPSVLSAFVAGRRGLWLESCCLALPSCEECWKRIMNISNLSSWKRQEKRALRNAIGSAHNSICHIRWSQAIYWLFLSFRFCICKREQVWSVVPTPAAAVWPGNVSPTPDLWIRNSQGGVQPFGFEQALQVFVMHTQVWERLPSRFLGRLREIIT